MYEIYLDESNGSIREEDDIIPSEETTNVENTNGEPNVKVKVENDDSRNKEDSGLEKVKLESSPIKEEKESRDTKDGKDIKDSKDGKDNKDSRSSKESKPSSNKDKQSHNLNSSGNNNVWVSGLSSSTRAAALQALFKKHGKVLSAKIITNPRIPGSRAHGFITMETAEQAEKCIQNLNKTELDGKSITVSKNRPSETSSSSRHKSSSSSSNRKDKPKEKDSKSKSDENKEPDKDKSKDDSKKSDDKSSHDDNKKKKEKSGEKDKEKEKEKDRHKDRDKEKEKSKGKEKEKDKEKEKSKDKEKKKDDDKDQSKDKSDKDKGNEKEKTKEKDKKDDKSKGDNVDDKKDDSKDDSKNKKDRSSKSLSRSRSRDRKKSSQSPVRKLLGRRPIRRLAPAFLARRMNSRGGRSTSSRPNPVLLRRIETERAQRRRERDREIQEAKRRRIELIRTQREVERKAQEERDRLEREMVKLRIERERLEREKAEILRLEREKARLERERLEREREELRRKQFQLPHRIDDSPRGRSGINKRPYDSRGDPRELDIHWDDRKRISAPSPVNASGRPSFNGTVGSRMSDFDARHGHSSAPYDNKGASYRRIKLDNQSSGGALRTEYDSRRDSSRGGGHDRDDRRSTGGPGGSGSGYYRDSARISGSSRDRDRRGGGGGGGRDDWKSSHDNRRDRYLDKGLTSMGTSYSTGTSYSGGNSGDWAAGDRGSSNMSKLSYPAGPSVSESRSRGAGMGSSLMTTGGNQLGDLYDSSSNIPMAGIMSHGGIGSTSGLNSDERPYLHSVRRF